MIPPSMVEAYLFFFEPGHSDRAGSPDGSVAGIIRLPWHGQPDGCCGRPQPESSRERRSAACRRLADGLGLDAQQVERLAALSQEERVNATGQ